MCKNAVALVQSLWSIDGIASITMTTSGILLAKYAASLKEARLGGINLSLDNVLPDTYRHITRIGDVTKALAGIDAAYNTGLPVKINCVPIFGLNIGDCQRHVAKLPAPEQRHQPQARADGK